MNIPNKPIPKYKQEQIKNLEKKNYSINSIAKKVEVDRATARKYINQDSK